MFFTEKEVELIRNAAATLPLTRGDTGKAQLSSLADYALNSTVPALVMDIEGRQRARPPKIRSEAASALISLVNGIRLTEEELRRLRNRDDQFERDRCLRNKIANALRYVNRLRTEPPRPTRPPGSGGQRQDQRQWGQRR